MYRRKVITIYLRHSSITRMSGPVFLFSYSRIVREVVPSRMEEKVENGKLTKRRLVEFQH